jgi:hypothetical protein
MGGNSTDLMTISTLSHEPLPEGFYQYYENPYAQVLFSKNYQAFIIEARNSYIPKEEFKDTFHVASELVSEETIDKGIFDKRALKTFDQPSMEWYFITWKTDLYEKYGLNKHVKILPDLPWFKKAVEAGKSDIFKKYPNTHLNNISIYYLDQIEEALNV